MSVTAVDRLRDRLRRRRDDDPRSVAERLGVLRDLERLGEQWRGVPKRADRIDAHLGQLLRQTGLAEGRVLEIGGRGYPRDHVFGPAFDYLNLDLEHGDERTMVGDITGCPEIADDTFDVVLSVDVFEHIDRPWLAASEISRIVRPGGLVYTSTLFSWRYHPCPIDFWRYSPDALEFLFSDVVTLEKGFDTSERRRDVRKKAEADPMPYDAMGGWRENVRVFHAGLKPLPLE